MVSIIAGRSALLAVAAASLASAGRDVFAESQPHRSNGVLPARKAERQRLRAEQRRERKRRDDEFRERMLRQRIAEGKDDRDDKYLHSAARRRRQEAASPLPAVSGMRRAV